MSEQPSNTMNTSDTTMWRIERDPALRSTIVGLTVLDSAPAWKDLRNRLVAVTRDIPRLRQRVVEQQLGYGSPRWVDDERFDLDFHLRRVVAAPPGDLQAVLDLAGPIQMAAFDKARPLWEFTLVEGLENGHAALVQKIHHSLTDGIGAIRLSRLLFDEVDGSAAVKPAAASTAGRHRTHDHEGSLTHGVRLVLDGLDQAVAATFHPLDAATGAVKTARSIAKLVQPVREPLSPVMRGRGLGRRLAAMDFSLEPLRAAGHAVDGTLNDAFLAALAGGMRRYHTVHGAQVAALRVTMPVNQRRDDDPEGSNKFAPARFTIAIDEPDPAKRMKLLGATAREQRREPGLRFTGQVAGLINLLPPPVTTALLGSMLKGIDFVATNVPGLTTPVALAGAPVRQQYAFAPPSGAAVSTALLSYLDVCTLGMVIDTTAVSDVAVFAECMAEGCAEVLAVGARPKGGRRRSPRKG